MSEMDGFVIEPKPAAYVGAGAIARLPAVVRAIGAGQAVVVTDGALAATPVIAAVMAMLTDAGIPSRLFAGVHPDPTTDDLAAGAAVVAQAAAEATASASAAAEAATVAATLKASAPLVAPPQPPASLAAPALSGPLVPPGALAAPPSAPSAPRIALVAVGGGPPIDAAKGIAIAAVNPQRGRDLDYRRGFAVPALPIVAVPTTAGTGTETSAFGVVTDPAAGRRFYIGHATARPAAAILDPELTAGLPPAATAAGGLDALTHALESYLSARPNPWSDGIALQATRMIAASLPRAYADGSDLAARSQMLLAAHLAGVAMASTGLGLCHAIGHSIGARWDIAHGVALAALLPEVLRFNLLVRTERMADIAFALGVGDTRADAGSNAEAAIGAVIALRDQVGLNRLIGEFGITQGDFGQIAADALDDEVLANAPRQPTREDIGAILLASAGQQRAG
jgi:alcohol dehydrogenase